MAKFERLLYKAKANLWTEPAKISLIRQALNKETRKKAQTLRPPPNTYVEYVKKLKEAVNSIHKSSRDKDAIDINNINVAKRPTASIQTLELAGPSRSSKSKYSAPSSSRAQLNLIQGLSSNNDNSDDGSNNDDDKEDSDSGHEFGYDHSTDSEPDFERKLERIAYGSRTRY